MTTSYDDKLVLARVQDAIRLSEQKGMAKYLGFLDVHKSQIAKDLLNSLKYKSYCFYGGYSQAERVYLSINVDREQPDTSEFPIMAIRITWSYGKLSHRDFLGSILSLGIERDKIGDIVINDNSCIVFAENAVAKFIMQNLIKVGGTGVSCEISDGENLIKDQQFKEIRTTIASNRLDCIVSAVCNVSRTEAEALITTGKVTLDFREASQTTQKVNEGSTISIRQYGRFIIIQIGPANRKGRFALLANKYL